jgi:DNA-binding MarR family transcriptional regulator
MDIASRTSFLVKRLQMQLAWLMEQELRKHGLTNGQFAVLSTIARFSGESSAEIARRLHVKPQALNEFVPPFEQRGLIERRGHPDNRRILCVYLTDEGKRMLALCNELVDRLEAELHQGLSSEELERFRVTTRKLSEAAGRIMTQQAKAEDAA